MFEARSRFVALLVVNNSLLYFCTGYLNIRYSGRYVIVGEAATIRLNSIIVVLAIRQCAA